MVNLSYCLCGDLLEVGSLAKGSRILGWLGHSYLTARKLQWDGSRITSLRDGYVRSPLRGMREIEGAGNVELLCVEGLWRMGGEFLLLPVWRSVSAGFIG